MIAVSTFSIRLRGIQNRFLLIPFFRVICGPTLDIRSTNKSESYAGGQSEVMMGQAIKKYQWKRSDIVISTKVSFRPGESK